MATLAGLAKPATLNTKPLYTSAVPTPTTGTAAYNANQAAPQKPLGNLSGQYAGQTNGALTPQLYAQYMQNGGNGNLTQRDAFTHQYFGGDQGAADYWLNGQSYGAGGQLVQHGPGSGAPQPGAPATPAAPPPGVGQPVSDSFPGANTSAQPGAVPSSASGQPDWSKLDISKFLDPNVDYRIQKGSEAIQNSAAAKGGLYSGATAKGITDYAGNEAQNAYQNAQSAAFNDRNFMRGTYTNDRDYTTNLGEFNANLANQQNQFNQNMGQRQNEFNTGVNQNDRLFDYNAQRDDRNFNYQSLSDLANLGMQGNNQVSNLQQLLARLTSANTIASGTAGAQGTLGGNNAIMQMIQQMIGMNSSNNLLSNLGLGGGN